MAATTRPIKQSERHVEAVLAALEILDRLLHNPAMTVKQLIDATGYTRNRIARLTGTLRHRGYLMLDTARGRYLPGPKLWALGKAFELTRGLPLLARPILRQLALSTGESASLYIREGLERVVLAREEGTRAIRYAVAEGQRMELHAGAGGKLLLAYASQEVISTLFSKSSLRVQRGARTIGDETRLRLELEVIRRQGYACSLSERIEDAGALAAPVFDGGGELVAALGIAGPASRFGAKSHGPYLEATLAAARDLSRLLGWQPAADDFIHNDSLSRSDGT
jgi:DNA-binding IclR family transcriptional regulator